MEDIVELDEHGHPADDEVDTGVFKALTDEFIQTVESRPPSSPPVANFGESPELEALTQTQTEARSRIQNILFLTRPPTFPDDE